jgi:hypothetical protein
MPPDAPQRHFLTIAQNELGRIARIITRMRDFYRPARDELELTEVNDLLAETIELVQTHLRHGHVTVTASFCPNLPLLVAHPDQLRQVFLNLMLNACDAMPNGGQLHISTELSCRNERDEQWVVVAVRDTGVGINPEHMPHLFEPFYTTKPQGTGLGLAISAHIVTQHGGHIQVESTPGVGSTFTVCSLLIGELRKPDTGFARCVRHLSVCSASPRSSDRLTRRCGDRSAALTRPVRTGLHPSPQAGVLARHSRTRTRVDISENCYKRTEPRHPSKPVSTSMAAVHIQRSCCSSTSLTCCSFNCDDHCAD